MTVVNLNVSASGEVADPNGLVDALAAAIQQAAPELVGGVNVTLTANLEPAAPEPATPAPDVAP